MGREREENGRRSPTNGSGCTPKGRQEKRKTGTAAGRLRAKRRQECGKRMELEGESARQKIMEDNSAEGDW